MDKEKFEERKQIFKDAVACKKPSRIPTLSNVWAWKILDVDMDPKPDFEEATSNWDIMEQIQRQHVERYQFDSFVELGFRFNSSYKKVLGGAARHEAAEGNNVQALDSSLVRADEYDELIEKGVDQFLWEKAFPRTVGEITFETMEKLVQCAGAFGSFLGRMYGALVSEYSCPIFAPDIIQTPVEELFNYYRGISGLSMDLRRCPGKVLDYIQAAEPAVLAKADEMIAKHDESSVCPFSVGFLAPTILNMKQFEKFYWPTVKKLFDKAEAAGKMVQLYIEGETGRFADYLNEYKPGTLAVQVEIDNIYELRKKMPHTCLMGGMPVTLLGTASKEECIKEAHRLCETLGESGFVFSQDKMVSYPNDAKRENLLAVQDFVLHYEL